MTPYSPLLADRLRAETATSHQRLEDALDLLAEPLSQVRFGRVLEGFFGFHQGWEPAIAAHADLAEVMSASRLPLLRADLRALGRSDAEIDVLPVCSGAAALVEDRSAAIGSLYVVEGSALGGQLIARALTTAPWRPAEGLRYFNPYGAAAARWRAFKAWLNLAPEAEHRAVIAGATATFDTLREWLAPAAVC